MSDLNNVHIAGIKPLSAPAVIREQVRLVKLLQKQSRKAVTQL